MTVRWGTDGGAEKGMGDTWWGGQADSVQATYREVTVGHASGDAVTWTCFAREEA